MLDIMSSQVQTLVRLNFQAVDQDEKKSITYTIVRGDTGRFRIAEGSGKLTTTQGLDYERQKQYTLVVSTREASGQNSAEYSATVSIAVLVSIDLHKRFLFYRSQSCSILR